MGNKSKYNYKRRKPQSAGFTQVSEAQLRQLTKGQGMSDTQNGIPNFTEGEMSIFMALAEAMKEVDRLREMVIALGGNPDIHYTSDDLGGTTGLNTSTLEDSKSE